VAENAVTYSSPVGLQLREIHVHVMHVMHVLQGVVYKVVYIYCDPNIATDESIIA
jgi:hypothetical protein